MKLSLANTILQYFQKKKEKSSNKFEIEKTCEYCGKKFNPKKITTRYCSHDCNTKAYKIAKRKEKLEIITKQQQIENSFIKESSEKTAANSTNKEMLSITEAAAYIGVSRPTIYSYLKNGDIQSIRLGNRVFIRRSDIDSLFNNPQPYKARPNKEKDINELYTIEEVKQKYNITESWIYKILRENYINKISIKGRTYISKQEIDDYFERNGFNKYKDIEEWYSVEDLKVKYNLSPAAIYSFVSEQQIPRKKIGRQVLYSKKDFDLAKGYIQLPNSEYYTTKEAMQKYNLARETLYHYVAYYNIPKIKQGRNIKILRTQFDQLFQNKK